MITLRPVPGFGSYPDGRLRAGPFSASHVGELHRWMDRYGIAPGAKGDQGMVSQTPQGIMISASGPGVHGYFLDRDGLEASQDDTDRFLLAVIKAGSACTISGHWCPDETRMIVSNATALNAGGEIQWTNSRMIIHADGHVRPLTAGGADPRALPRQRPKLRVITGGATIRKLS